MPVKRVRHQFRHSTGVRTFRNSNSRRKFFRKFTGVHRPIRRKSRDLYMCLARKDWSFTPSVNGWSNLIQVCIDDFPELSYHYKNFLSYQFLSCTLTVYPLSLNDTAHPCEPYIVAPWHFNIFPPNTNLDKLDREHILALNGAKEYRATRGSCRHFVPSIITTCNVDKHELHQLRYRPEIFQYQGSSSIPHTCGIICFPSNTHDVRYELRLSVKVLFKKQIWPQA